jgi:predicted RNase H-like nuclease
MYFGVDGCPDGWIAVGYSDSEFAGAWFHRDIAALWEAHHEADRILVDVPIGLRTESSEPRGCDTAARSLLSPDRHHSVFPTPVRTAAYEGSYEAAKATQERLTDGSLNRQTWGITPKIAAVDTLLRENVDARATIRESHPEVCFCAFAGEPMRHSKTRESRQAYWERLSVLRAVEPDVYDHLWAAAQSVDGDGSTDDLVDAFAVALTARGDETGLQTLPETVERDAEGLPMDIVYRPLDG